MNHPVPNIVIPRRDVPSGIGSAHVACAEVGEPLMLDEFVHDIRQPLEVIESLAYYLEMVSRDESTVQHLQRIRAMVVRAHGILERVV